MTPFPSGKNLLTGDFHQARRLRPRSSVFHNARQLAKHLAQRTFWECLHGVFQEPCRHVLLPGAADRVGFGGEFFEEIVGVDAGGVDGIL